MNGSSSKQCQSFVFEQNNNNNTPNKNTTILLCQFRACPYNEIEILHQYCIKSCRYGKILHSSNVHSGSLNRGCYIWRYSTQMGFRNLSLKFRFNMLLIMGQSAINATICHIHKTCSNWTRTYIVRLTQITVLLKSLGTPYPLINGCEPETGLLGVSDGITMGLGRSLWFC